MIRKRSKQKKISIFPSISFCIFFYCLDASLRMELPGDADANLQVRTLYCGAQNIAYSWQNTRQPWAKIQHLTKLGIWSFGCVDDDYYWKCRVPLWPLMSICWWLFVNAMYVNHICMYTYIRLQKYKVISSYFNR